MKNILFVILFTGIISMSCESDSSNLPSGNGKGGSMATFALGKNHLYVVDSYSLKVFGVESNGSLIFKTSIDIDFGIETIFAYGDNLFMGSTDAMYTYSVVNPDYPVFVSRYSHIRSCDPVVVNGNYAYVTLRTGSTCRFDGENALEIINITDPTLPVLVNSYPVNSPYGLGIDGNALFLCEGDHGMKVYDVQDPSSITLIKQYQGMNSYDVIPHDGVLIMTGDDGIFQYDYTNLSDIKLLSHIAIQK